MLKDFHNYHFVLTNVLKGKIIKLSTKLKLSKTKTIIHILNETICILNKYQFDFQENSENLDYQRINWDTDIHVYMDKNFYRKLKHLADSVFSFSIAIIVRKLIELYFKILEKSEDNVLRVRRVLKKFYMIYVNKYGNKIKQWKKNIKDEQLCGKFYYYLKYNDKFSITEFKFDDF